MVIILVRLCIVQPWPIASTVYVVVNVFSNFSHICPIREKSGTSVEICKFGRFEWKSLLLSDATEATLTSSQVRATKTCYTRFVETTWHFCDTDRPVALSQCALSWLNILFFDDFEYWRVTSIYFFVATKGRDPYLSPGAKHRSVTGYTFRSNRSRRYRG